MDNPTPLPPATPPTSRFSSLARIFRNRKIVLTLILIVLMSGYGVWAYYGFSLEVFRFFADEIDDIPPQTLPPGSGIASIICSSDADCDDGDPGTLDICVNPGTPNSFCKNPPNNAEVCNDGIDNDGNGLVDCADPQCNGSQACSPGQITCFGDGDCNDGDPLTRDICVNPGQTTSFCKNPPISTPTPTPIPIAGVDLRVNGTQSVSVAWGTPVTLSWGTIGVTLCGAAATPFDTNWQGARPRDGSESLTATQTGEYQLKCNDAAGNPVVDSVQITVTNPTPTPALTGTIDLKVEGSDGPLTVSPGQNVALQWKSTGVVSSCLAGSNPEHGQWQSGAALGNNGSKPATMVFSTLFKISCTDGNGNSLVDTVQVNVSTGTSTPTPTSTPTSTPSPTPGTPQGCNSFNVVKTAAFTVGGSSVTGHVRNNSSDSCKVIMAAYKIYSDQLLSSQTRYSYKAQILSPGESASITTSLPPCASQNDLVVGSANEADDLIAPPSNPNFLPANFISANWTSQGQWCTAGGPTPAPTSTPAPTATTSASVTATPSPTPVPISCSPASQTRYPSELATINAAGGNGTYSWSAPNGTPTAGSGASFGVAYSTTGTYNVTVTSAGQNAVCTVIVVQQPTGLSCSPATQSAYIDQTVNFSAAGGSGAYSWSAPSAVVTTGSGAGFSTRYSNTGNYTVIVTSGSESRTCNVSINLAPTPTPTPTPSTPGISLVKLVRNITSGSGEVDVVSANPGDTVEFMIRINSYGNTTARNVRVTDTLPQGLAYATGSTTVDGSAVSDGITSGGILLGDIAPGRTITVRFRALVASASTFSIGTTTLTNVVVATSDNVPTVTDQAFVNVTRTGNQIVIEKLGRNLTRGEYSEQRSVTAYPNNTLEFILHVRSVSSVTITSVVVRDTLPSSVAYIAGTTSVNGVIVGDGIAGSGIDIGPLAPGQEKIVRFSGRVASASNLPVGTSSATNTAQVTNPNVISQMPIIIINGIVAGVGKVPTGAQDSILASVLVSLIITLMYVAYTRTQIFKTRELKSMLKHTNGGEDTFDFKK